jgi:hypothetical protein
MQAMGQTDGAPLMPRPNQCFQLFTRFSDQSLYSCHKLQSRAGLKIHPLGLKIHAPAVFP